MVDTSRYFGWDFDGYDDGFQFIDGYSWREGGEVEDRFALEGPSDLNQMNMALADALSELGQGRKRVVLDSVSTLVLYTDPASAVRFLQVVAAKSKASNGALVMTLEDGVHDEETMSTLNYVADGVIRMKMENGRRMLSVERMVKTRHPTGWKEYSIDEEEGIVLGGGVEVMA